MPDKDPSNQQFHLTIVNPNKLIFEADVKRVIAPGSTQDIAILPDHTPLYSNLIKGEIEVTLLNDQIQKIPIDGGIIRVKLNIVSIIIGF
jgi:F-type H+-transporting ATPase subunit epsilon